MCLRLINSENLVMISKSFTINYPYSSRTQHLIIISLSCEIWNTVRNELGKEYIKAAYRHPAYLLNVQSTSCKMPGWMKHKMESRLLGEIPITSDMQIAYLHMPYGRKQKGTEEPLDESERGE